EAGQCVQTHVCGQITGCRITGGGIAPDGEMDLSTFAGISKGSLGGQVGAPCGCIGCFDNFDNIQGNWQYRRKTKLGNFHAMDFTSLVCGCEDLNGNTIMLDGTLCGTRDIGPTPPAAPANVACFSGKGQMSPASLGKKTLDVAFRVEIEDRGEPGTGPNSGPSPDVYRIRIWVPTSSEKLADLVAGACCTLPSPTNRQPAIDDGGSLTTGDLQIHAHTTRTA